MQVLSTLNANNYDAKKYKVCCPWDSKRGNSWTLIFKPAFEDGCRGQIDNWSSWYELIVTETDYGGANGPPHPGGAGAAVNIQSTAARRTRIEACYSAILLHACQLIGNNERVKAYVAQVLTGAPTVAAANAANAAIAAANVAVAAAQAQNVAINAANAALGVGVAPQPLVAIPAVPAPAAGVAGVLPDDWLPRVWRYIDTNIGSPVNNGVLDSNQNTEFEQIKITDVGINRDTPQLFLDLLIRHNNQRRTGKSVMDLWIKFHQNFTFPRVLADRSINELLNPSVLIPAGLPNAGQPDLQALVTNVYTDLWHTVWDKGIEIKPQAAPAPRPVRSGRVDGMQSEQQEQLPAYMSEEITLPPVNTNLYTDPGVGFTSHYFGSASSQPAETIPLLDQAHAAAVHRAENARTGIGYDFLKTEKNCWGCGGWGHVKSDCPSDKSVRRSRAACIHGLQLLLEQDQSRLKNLKTKRITRKPGRSPGNRPRPAIAMQAEIDAEEFIQYDDGGIYTTLGDEVSPPHLVALVPPTEPPSQLESQTAAVVSTPRPAPPAPTPCTTSPVPAPALAPTVQAQAAQETPAPPMSTVMNPATVEAQIEQDFASGHNLNGFSSQTVADDFEYFQAPQHRWAAAKAGAAGAVCAVALMLGATAMMLRSTRTRALLTLLTIGSASACTANTAHEFSRQGDVKVYASQYSRSQCFDMESRSVLQAISPKKPRDHGVMDSGTSECASSREKLFPSKLIEQWNPPIKVEIASGLCL
ncbi:MAG: hypothetical protein GWP37_01790, partial [Gammaproteobacteria bacterium]|nr:hypothetical protein [Gammaproteobacteria bacterium]